MNTGKPHAKNTIDSYRLAWRQFLEYQNVTTDNAENFIMSTEPAALARMVDETFCTLYSVANTRRLKISGARHVIENDYLKILPRSMARPVISKHIPKFSTTAELNPQEVLLLDQYFHKRYTERKGNEKIQGLRDYMIFLLLSRTGQRISDILNLKVKEIKKNNLLFQQTKTGKVGKCQNPIMDLSALYIQIIGLHDEEFLFASGISRKPITRQRVNTIIKQAGMITLRRDDLSPHAFRAYVTETLHELGYSNRETGSITGHSDRMGDYYDRRKPQIENSNALLDPETRIRAEETKKLPEE